jgi:hypothetical protein
MCCSPSRYDNHYDAHSTLITTTNMHALQSTNITTSSVSRASRILGLEPGLSFLVSRTYRHAYIYLVMKEYTSL